MAIAAEIQNLEKRVLAVTHRDVTGVEPTQGTRRVTIYGSAMVGSSTSGYILI